MLAAMAERRSAPELVPERIGRYEILLPIASGGMATVYLARARGPSGFERDVALKLTHAHLRESAEFARELVEEAKLAVRIRHANVVPVLDMGDDPFGLFLVMEYIEGDTLSGLVRRSAAAGAPLAPRVGLRILLDALAGLHFAHELKDDGGEPLGLVHRDFSPQNILVGLDGVGRLTDFGIAKAATRLGQTRTGMIKGKIAYMSPEQARGQRVDRRCDVWAGGVMAWEILAGRRLYGGAEDVGLLFRIATETPPRLRTVQPDIGPEIDEVIARALAPDPDARIGTAGELAREMARALRASHVDLAEPAEVGEQVERLVGRRLTERRARAKEVLALRAKLDRATRADRSSPGETPDSDAIHAAVRAMEDKSREDAISESISVHTAMIEDAKSAAVVLTAAESPSARRLGGAQAAGTEAATRTDTSAVAVVPATKRPSTWLMVGALMTVAAAAGVLALALSSTSPARSVAPSSQPAQAGTANLPATSAALSSSVQATGVTTSAVSAPAVASSAVSLPQVKVRPVTTQGTPAAAPTKPRATAPTSQPDLSKPF
jgi:serine/threonine-protein kinase